MAITSEDLLKQVQSQIQEHSNSSNNEDTRKQVLIEDGTMASFGYSNNCEVDA